MTKEQECMKALQCLYLEVPSVIADDVKQKVIDAMNEVKNCTIPDVSNRRELLFAFLKANENVTIPDYDSNKYLMIDAFLGKQ